MLQVYIGGRFMKKTVMLLACVLVFMFGVVSVEAYDSPEIPSDTESISIDTDSNTDTTKIETDTITDTDPNEFITDVDSDSTKKDTDSQKKNTDSDDTDKKTSPKTGTPASYGILLASAAALFGCAAVTIKRKIKD